MAPAAGRQLCSGRTNRKETFERDKPAPVAYCPRSACLPRSGSTIARRKSLDVFAHSNIIRHHYYYYYRYNIIYYIIVSVPLRLPAPRYIPTRGCAGTEEHNIIICASGLDENIIKRKTIAIVIQMTIDRPPILYALRTVNVRLFVLTV